MSDEYLTRIAQRMREESSCASASRDRALLQLQLIVESVRAHAGTGQSNRLVAFMAGLYNGERFPFDLMELRCLDRDLADACLAVLDYDRYGRVEIHRWGVVGADELNQWILEYGHYYSAQRRRISHELYRSQYGAAGHCDEGLTG